MVVLDKSVDWWPGVVVAIGSVTYSIMRLKHTVSPGVRRFSSVRPPLNEGMLREDFERLLERAASLT